MSSRDAILAAIRTANTSAPVVPAIERTYRRRGEHLPGSPALLDLFADRLVDYKAVVHRTPAAELAATLRAALDQVGATGRPVLLPPEPPADWGLHGTLDDGTPTPVDLDGFAAVVSGCAAACAETGTIALDGSPDQGRRAITLVPDVHLCVVHTGQVVQTVPELIGRLVPDRPITFVSGPSATSDIELQRVEGVHGPRTLIVVLVS
ncbi:LutC/YkgG family protein [Pseudonocardia acidicola]|uniref:LUD domain-containing protein n=1 Tax=Pseudonocardia acidicola TaxID=2724939 RepID=A0ABX1S775_9PSEU|nr:LUD domain-containing protein [Pseudonocardia acidicola]NMH96960.1 LUD domain-containing protein [Pseudonocardia acidicola]